ncbi:MAG: hypothetical protein ACXW2A_05885 [Burkholderiales bacterium]
MAMYGGTIYTKTRNGVLAFKGRKRKFSSEVRTVFLSLDGKASIAELVTRLGLSAARVEQALEALELEGFAKIARHAEKQAAPRAITGEVDLDFTYLAGAEGAPEAEAQPVVAFEPVEELQPEPAEDLPPESAEQLTPEFAEDTTLEAADDADPEPQSEPIESVDAQTPVEAAHSLLEDGAVPEEPEQVLVTEDVALTEAGEAAPHEEPTHTRAVLSLVGLPREPLPREEEDPSLAEARARISELESELGETQAGLHAANEACAQQAAACASLEQQLAEQRRTAAKAKKHTAEAQDLAASVDRARETAYQHALACAQLEAQLESERRAAETAQQELTVHVQELKAALERQQELAYRDALEHADVEAQLAHEIRAREEAEARARTEREARELALKSVADMQAATEAQARASAEAAAKYAEYEARLQTAHAGYGKLEQELDRVRTALESQVRAEREAREGAEARARAEERAAREAQAQLRARVEQTLVDAKRAADDEDRALSEAQHQCETLTALIEKTTSALDLVRQAARAHVSANAQLEAHLLARAPQAPAPNTQESPSSARSQHGVIDLASKKGASQGSRTRA